MRLCCGSVNVIVWQNVLVVLRGQALVGYSALCPIVLVFWSIVSLLGIVPLLQYRKPCIKFLLNYIRYSSGLCQPCTPRICPTQHPRKPIESLLATWDSNATRVDSIVADVANRPSQAHSIFPVVCFAGKGSFCEAFRHMLRCRKTVSVVLDILVRTLKPSVARSTGELIELIRGLQILMYYSPANMLFMISYPVFFARRI